MYVLLSFKKEEIQFQVREEYSSQINKKKNLFLR